MRMLTDLQVVETGVIGTENTLTVASSDQIEIRFKYLHFIANT